MYGLSIGVSNIGDTMPRAAYALLSGLNAATVGVIALAAIELSEKAITDKLTRILVFLSATAGLMYNALWYFPLLMFLAGCASVIFDYRWFHGPVAAMTSFVRRRRVRPRQEEESVQENVQLQGSTQSSARDATSQPAIVNRQVGIRDTHTSEHVSQEDLPVTEGRSTAEDEPRVIPVAHRLNFSWKVGAVIVGSFLVTFTVIMVLRGVLPNRPLLYSLFANMYLAGTIIFGGGPVVIPLLREYVVAEGWVSPRDFLIGLAIIQAFPGPNFNFAVFLGSLTAINGGFVSASGAVLGFLGIFVPGLVLAHGTMGIWGALRSKRWVKSGLRGINAAAVGLIYTAVYRLWQIGYIDEAFQSGSSLADDPWWVVVTATSYVGGRWFGASPPLAIISGAVLGLVRYGVVSR